MYRIAALATIAGGILVGCTNSTRYVSSWKDPTTPSFHLQHTLAVFMTKDVGVRRMVEERLASRLPGGVPSYRVIPDAELTNIDSLRAHVAAANFDGAVVMRLTDEQTVTTTNYNYPGFYGYWGYWNNAYGAYPYTSKLYSVETTLYSMPNGKLVWMGRSETMDPKNENKLADYSVNFAVNNMKRDGYIR